MFHNQSNDLFESVICASYILYLYTLLPFIFIILREILRQLMTRVMEDFLSSLTPPSSRQDPLLRQLAESIDVSDENGLDPPEYRQNPLLR